MSNIENIKNNFVYSKGLSSENTSKTYATIVEVFLKYYNYNEQTIINMDYAELTNYFKLMNDNGRKASTINTHMTVIKEFYKELELHNYTINKQVYLIKKMKISSVDSYYIPTKEEITKLMEIARNEKQHSQEKELFIKIAYATAFRYTALDELKVKDVYMESDNYYITSIDKGNKRNTSRISKNLFEEINLFETTKGLNRNDKLFTISYKTLTRFIKKAQNELGLENENFTLHSIRKASIDYVVSTNTDIRIAQAHANHASASTTIDIYSKKIDKDMLPIVGAYDSFDNEALLNDIDGEKLKLLLLNKLTNTELSVLLNKIM